MKVYGMAPRGAVVCALCFGSCSGACASQPYLRADQKTEEEHWEVHGMLTLIYRNGQEITAADFSPSRD